MNTTYDILKNLHLIVNANYVFEKSKGRSNLSDGNGNTNATLLHLAELVRCTLVGKRLGERSLGFL